MSLDVEYPEHILLRLPAGTKVRIERARSSTESIAELLRAAVEHELARREGEKPLGEDIAALTFAVDRLKASMLGLVRDIGTVVGQRSRERTATCD
jgi:hypothetical protein